MKEEINFVLIHNGNELEHEQSTTDMSCNQENLETMYTGICDFCGDVFDGECCYYAAQLDEAAAKSDYSGGRYHQDGYNDARAYDDDPHHIADSEWNGPKLRAYRIDDEIFVRKMDTGEFLYEEPSEHVCYVCDDYDDEDCPACGGLGIHVKELPTYYGTMDELEDLLLALQSVRDVVVNVVVANSLIGGDESE